MPTKSAIFDGLSPIGKRPPLSQYLSDIWQLRHFITLQAKYRSFTGSKGTLLGRSWLLLEPFMRILMYYITFGILLNVKGSVDNFVGFLAIGVILFTPMTNALLNGSTIIERNRPTMRGFSFPRAVLVLVDTLKSLRDSVPEIIALLLFIWIAPPHETPNVTWFAFVFVLLLRHIFTMGITFLAARIATILPDMRLIWPVLSRFWFYGSGVFFSIDHYVTDPTLQTIMMANPAYLILDMSRSILLYDTLPVLSHWLQLGGWSLLLLVVGIAFFWQGEERYNRAR